jgi:hypothetical protein
MDGHKFGDIGYRKVRPDCFNRCSISEDLPDLDQRVGFCVRPFRDQRGSLNSFDNLPL